MTRLEQAEIPAINPIIAKFDDINDTIAYVADMSIGVLPIHMQQYVDDKFDYYAQGLKLLRSKDGKPLRDFMRFCGKISALGEIDEESDLFEKAANSIIVNPEDDDAYEQASMVIGRFATKQNLAAFNKLYGTPKKTAPKKPVREKGKKTGSQLVTPDVIAAVASDAVKKPAPVSVKDKAPQQYVVRREVVSEKQVEADMVRFTDAVGKAIKSFIGVHGGNVIANRVYRFLEDEFRGTIDRDDARVMLQNVMATGDRNSIYRSGTQGGSLHVSIDKKLAEEEPKTTPEVSKHNETIEDNEDLSKHELVPLIFKRIVAVGHQNKGLTARSITLSLGVEESEARAILQYLVDVKALARLTRWERSRSPRSSKKEALYYIFPTQKDWDLYKTSPTKYLDNLTNSQLS